VAEKESPPTEAGLSWWDVPFIIVIGVLLIPAAMDLFNMVVRALTD